MDYLITLLPFVSSFVNVHGSGMLVLISMTLIACGMVHAIIGDLRVYVGSALTLLVAVCMFLGLLVVGDEGYIGKLLLSSSFLIGIITYLTGGVYVWIMNRIPGLVFVYTIAMVLGVCWYTDITLFEVAYMSLGVMGTMGSLTFFRASLIDGDTMYTMLALAMSIMSMVLLSSSLLVFTY